MLSYNNNNNNNFTTNTLSHTYTFTKMSPSNTSSYNKRSLAVPKPSISTDSHGNSSFNRPLAIFSDFDGTIFLQDTGHILFDNFGCGKEKRIELDGKIGTGELSFKAASEEMWSSLNVTLEDGVAKMKQELVMDEKFREFFNYTVSHEIPFNVISAGLKPLLRSALDAFLGEEKSAKVGIVSNDADISKDGSSWVPKWRHNCELGHDKAKSIKDFKMSVKGEMPLIVFIGDGVSDLAAASQADILFARQGLPLEDYCIKYRIPYIPYKNFGDIEEELDNLVVGNKYHDTTAKKIGSRPSYMRTSSTSQVPVESSRSMNPLLSAYVN